MDVPRLFPHAVRDARAEAARGSLSRARNLTDVLLRTTALAGIVFAVSLAGTADVRAQGDSVLGAIGGTVEEETPLLLEARELRYDFDRDVISAVGDVQIYYGDYAVEADRVDLNRRTQVFTASGNVRMTEPNGNVVTADKLALSEDFRDGFANALQLDTPQRTRFIADGANRSEGNLTTFDNGLYTVYTRPTTPPGKPPLWRVTAAKIIHNQQEQTIYFEDAKFEFFGKPIAYLPYLSMPDPTVRNKTGFLVPSLVVGGRVGVGATVPYEIVIDESRDLLLQATPLTKQGALVQGEWRQRLINGAYSISAGGLYQAQPNEFAGSSGDRDFRGVIASDGKFNINSRWSWGWDLSLRSDRAFLKDYNFTKFGRASDISNIFLLGQTERNRFEADAYAFRISQEDYNADPPTLNAGVPFSPVGSDLQDKQPFVHPVIDWNYIFEDPLAGGELSLAGNFTSLTRDETDAIRVKDTTNRFRGVEGTFTRATLDGQWRRSLIDPLGQVFTPFAYVQGDVFFLASADDNVAALTDEAVVGRIMPAAGLEYRYPFIATFDGGNHVLEPIGQIVIRPDEQRIGDLPNEDAQSIVFDSTTLFEWDKFSGFDRSEGGTRANLGVRYKLQLDEGSYLSALFGRSYQLAGENSFATPDILDATGNSGLDSTQSDYVGSLYFDSTFGFRIGGQARFDREDFNVNRAQVQASGIYGPVVGTLAYAFLDAQPDLGIDAPREELLGSTSVRVEENWRLFGSLRYDIENSNIVQNGIGVGYDDEGFSVSMTYSEDRSRNNGELTDRLFFLRLGFRTLGATQFSSGISEE
ncbi:LPS assembly protein LptD [Stappia sp. GBMRC 2046]|uniref:LPS-assembly protein LptD n=1 Tax=Stappia sediminis TaxID=2692190 RepID=A0A7X3LSU2_9HYPH|nr:LPS-assembly protein LptD [Stappia sediminis]MXN64464.1 LPS assembly protein LptD [Stappia sediminis]